LKKNKVIYEPHIDLSVDQTTKKVFFFEKMPTYHDYFIHLKPYRNLVIKLMYELITEENVIKVKEPVFTDYKLLDKLIELAEIVPQILMDSKINKYSDAVLSNSIIIFLNNARPPIANNNAIIKRKRSNNNNVNQPTKNRKIAWQAGTRKIRKKSKRTRRNKVKCN
jgi:hypothetical protein